MDKRLVFTSLSELSENYFNQLNFNKLVEVTISIGVKHLGFCRSKLSKISGYDETELFGISTEAITPLFIKKDYSDFPIIRSFKSWYPQITTEEDALFFLTKIVAKRIEQHLSYLYKINDPEFAKILNHVNYLVIKNDLIKERYCGVTYLQLEKTNFFNKKLIPSDVLQTLPSNLFDYSNLDLSKIFEHLEIETEYYKAIPLNDLVYQIKLLLLSGNIKDYSNPQVEENIAADYYVKKGLTSAIKKLKIGYFEKGKLNENEFICFSKVLDNICIDLRDGGVSDSLFSYLKLEMNELVHDEYMNKYRNTLEYIYKHLKKSIAEEIKNDL